MRTKISHKKSLLSFNNQRKIRFYNYHCFNSKRM